MSPLRIFNGFMAALFLFAASLQFNDPNPLRWIVMYLVAGIVCLLAACRRLRWQVAAVVAAATLGWASIYATRGAWSVPFSAMFDEWEMKNQQVLETREMFGLLIVTFWMTLLAVTGYRARRPTARKTPAAPDESVH